MKVELDGGLVLDIDDEKLDDYELLEALTDVDNGKATRVIDAVNILLGDSKPVLLDHIRKEKGYVSTAIVTASLIKIIEGMKGKKS